MTERQRVASQRYIGVDKTKSIGYGGMSISYEPFICIHCLCIMVCGILGNPLRFMLIFVD